MVTTTFVHAGRRRVDERQGSDPRANVTESGHNRRAGALDGSTIARQSRPPRHGAIDITGFQVMWSPASPRNARDQGTGRTSGRPVLSRDRPTAGRAPSVPDGEKASSFFSPRWTKRHLPIDAIAPQSHRLRLPPTAAHPCDAWRRSPPLRHCLASRDVQHLSHPDLGADPQHAILRRHYHLEVTRRRSSTRLRMRGQRATNW